MDAEKQLRTIEDELALLKGELKETLSSVRDYLIDIDSTDDDNTPLSPDNKIKEKATTRKSVDESLDTTEEFKVFNEENPEDDAESETNNIFESEEPFIAGADLPYDSQSDEYPEMHHSVPKVSLLANLINWVTVARREIGEEQLPAFLEVYGISGHLSQEMKDVILHLAKITAEKPGQKSTAEVWSNSMLSLHGILTGGETSHSPEIPHWDSKEEAAEDLGDEPVDPNKSGQMPVKLKLVFPNGDGKGKEYCIDLTPESSGDKEKSNG